MARREFTTAVRVAAAKRATGADGVMRCERKGCGGVLIPGRWQLDHLIPDALGGEPTLVNAQCLCEPCWREKNPKDTTDAAKAKRREADHLGATMPTGRKLQGAGFPKTSRKRERHPMPLPLRARPFYTEDGR